MASQRMLLALILLGAGPECLSAVRLQQRANPIRKVVTLLQKMQAEVTADGEKQEAAYKKFMCYCKTGVSTLEASIEASKDKIEALETSLKGDGEKKKQTEAALKEHKASRAEAKSAMAEATAVREKEAAAFKKESSDTNMNLAALEKAIAAVETGANAFLQTSAANVVRRFTMEKAVMNDMQRQEVLAFLSGTESEGYVPQSGEITGILKTMHDEMTKALKDATAQENDAIADYEALMAAKKKEVAILTKQIEAELAIIGELGVSVATMQNELEDAKESLAVDEKFLAELKKGCATKTAEWEEIKKTRAEELLALAETIKVLNDDDALELFKKTLPSASSASFVQVQVSASQMKTRALSLLHAALKSGKRSGALSPRPQMDLIALALSGRGKFDKVVGMIDNMVALLKKEQENDDKKKGYCEAEFDASEDKQKLLENSIADSNAAIATVEGSIESLKEEIANLRADIKALDASVAKATELRKQEHSDYEALMAADGTAKEVLLWAKNRLNKFYAPKLYKAPAGRELTEEQSITVSMGGTLAPTPAPGGIANTGIGASLEQTDSEVAPPPPPETFGPYQKKGESGRGVTAMIDLLVADLDKEMQESKVMETDAQKEYEEMMADSAAKRAQDAKSLTDKVASQAAEEEALQAETDKKDGTSKELMTTLEYINSLHGECDWLVKYYDVRKSARAEEIDNLGRAKAVLSGADYA